MWTLQPNLLPDLQGVQIFEKILIRVQTNILSFKL